MGQPAILVSRFDMGRTLLTTSNTVTIPTPGCYHYQLQWFDKGGGAAAAALTASGPGQVGTQLVGDLAGGSTLAVYQGTDSPTECRVVAVRKAPSIASQFSDTMDVTVTDLDGIGGIYNVQATNASVAVVPSGWWASTTGPLLVRATKQNQGQPAAFSFTVSDWNGTVKVCT